MGEWDFWAKTYNKQEIVQNESRTEEDNFIAAIEWGESLGADVVSASLGYTMWYVNTNFVFVFTLFTYFLSGINFMK